jgi:hypothetical protein
MILIAWLGEHMWHWGRENLKIIYNILLLRQKQQYLKTYDQTLTTVSSGGCEAG